MGRGPLVRCRRGCRKDRERRLGRWRILQLHSHSGRGLPNPETGYAGEVRGRRERGGAYGPQRPEERKRRMKLLSVNVSLPREVAHGSETVSTGIFKEPVVGRVMLRTSNLDGDGQADLENHGGIYRATYAYSIENYDHWRRELGRADLTFGQFGENFTVEGMVEDDIYIGDVFRVGDALVE